MTTKRCNCPECESLRAEGQAELMIDVNTVRRGADWLIDNAEDYEFAKDKVRKKHPITGKDEVRFKMLNEIDIHFAWMFLEACFGKEIIKKVSECAELDKDRHLIEEKKQPVSSTNSAPEKLFCPKCGGRFKHLSGCKKTKPENAYKKKVKR
jgi:hypothetical protein